MTISLADFRRQWPVLSLRIVIVPRKKPMPVSPGRPIGSKTTTGNKPLGKAKFSDVEKTEVMHWCGMYDRRGMSQYQIVAALKAEHGVEVSQPYVSGLLKDVRAGYVVLAVEERRRKVAEFAEMYRDIRAEAWEMWYLSKQEFLKETHETVVNASGEGGYEKYTKTKEGRLASAEYMRIVLQTIKDEREMMGLDVPVETKVNMTGTMGMVNVNFDDLAKAALTSPRPAEVIEQRIREAGMLPEHKETRE